MPNSFRSILVLMVVALLSLPGFAADAAKPGVNINTADAEQIAEVLTGVGLAKAKAIIAYRDSHGPFKSSDELMAVKGIGEATVRRNAEKILLTE